MIGNVRMSHTLLTTSDGEEMVLLPRRDYDAMRDALDAVRHARAMADVTAGRIETLSQAEVVAALAEATPLAFWRKKRSLTQRGLASQAGISQSYLSELENGHRRGDPALYRRLARLLDVRMEDIVAED